MSLWAVIVVKVRTADRYPNPTSRRAPGPLVHLRGPVGDLLIFSPFCPMGKPWSCASKRLHRKPDIVVGQHRHGGPVGKVPVFDGLTPAPTARRIPGDVVDGYIRCYIVGGSRRPRSVRRE